MSYDYEIQCLISSNNSNSLPLTSSATYTGLWEECWKYSSLSTIVSTDKAGTLYIDFSSDGANTDRAVTLSSGGVSDISGIHNLTPVAKYYRIRLVNGSEAQSYLRIQTILNPTGRVSVPTSRLSQPLGDFTDVLNVRAGLVGKSEGGGVWTPISSTDEGHLEVQISSPVTAFGEVSVSEPLPVAQLDFVYGENYRTSSNSATNGVFGAANSMIFLSTSNNANSFAQVNSKRYLKYRPGQGALGRYTAVFNTGVANANQYAGLATTVLDNGFLFGFQGTTFGVWYIRNNSSSFIVQNDWNLDKMDGTQSSTNKSGVLLDPSKGNVYQISYQYLGFGAIVFSIENPFNGQFTPVHEIRYSNSSELPSIEQPSLNMVWRVQNYTNTSNVTMRAASCALFLEGKRAYLGPRNAFNNNKTGITTEVNIFTIKNATSFNGKRNVAFCRIRSISFGGNASGATAVGSLRVIKNATLGGSPSWTQIEGTSGDSGATVTGSSVISVDVAGTTVTGGIPIYNSVVAMGSSTIADVTDLDIYLQPGETATFAVSSTSTGTAGVGIVWNEDI